MFRRVPFLSSIIGENIITIITSRLIIPICTCSFLQFVYNFKVLDFCRLYSDVHSPTITNLKFKLAAGNDQSTSNNSNDK
jgi:hypothetical protein